MVETLFKLACLMVSGFIALAYLAVSFENQANAKKAAPVVYTTVSENTTAPAKKKNCNCCAERREQARRFMERRRKMVKQARERAQAEQSVTSASTP